MVFSIVFAGVFYWFYNFTTDKITLRLRSDMRSTLEGAAAGVDVDELMALYAEGERNAEGFSDDPRYQNQLDWFEVVHSIEPRAWLYSGVVGIPDNLRRFGEPAVPPDRLEMVYLVDLWANYDLSKSVRFLESDEPSSRARQVYEQGQLIEESEIYSDRWGSWLSAFAPLRDDEGRIVAVIGLDIEADYVLQVQQAIRDRFLLSFIVTYGILFVLIYVLSGVLTQRLTILTQSAERIALGNYDQDLSVSGQSPFPDEMHTLAQVFQFMINSIRTREQLIRAGKEAEDEMRHALEAERELNELKSRFVSMVSHELRTPLTVIRTSVELLEHYNRIATEDKKREYFLRIRSAIKTMIHLVEDVLTLSKAEAGKLEFCPTLIDLEQFCWDIVDEMQLSGNTGHTIIWSYEGGNPKAYIDRKLLRSILTNLLSNAIKYSANASEIEFKLFCSEQTAKFEIKDYGIGIPLADQPHLFESFHRARNAHTIRGTGLGLAIVQQCVLQHQGKITFVSQEGIGTTFCVTLPRYPTVSPEPELSSDRPSLEKSSEEN